jgi:hypothetical protein
MLQTNARRHPFHVIAEDGIRFLAHEAKVCRDRDLAEAICLLLPSMCQLLCVEPMDDYEAIEYRLRLREELREQVNPDPVLITS